MANGSSVTRALQAAARRNVSKTQRRKEIALEILNGPITPLEIMWAMARGRKKFDAQILEACKACAPYVHPKLQMVHISQGAGVGVTHEQALEALDSPALMSLSEDGEELMLLDDQQYDQLALEAGHNDGGTDEDEDSG